VQPATHGIAVSGGVFGAVGKLALSAGLGLVAGRQSVSTRRHQQQVNLHRLQQSRAFPPLGACCIDSNNTDLSACQLH
jgi:hypothetical protein